MTDYGIDDLDRAIADSKDYGLVKYAAGAWKKGVIVQDAQIGGKLKYHLSMSFSCDPGISSLQKVNDLIP